jgi:hypothetical protein
MTPRIPKLPPTTTVNHHELHIDYVLSTTAHRTWTVTEHFNTVTVGHPSLHYDHGTFTTDTSTGTVTGPDWHVVLEHAFARA